MAGVDDRDVDHTSSHRPNGIPTRRGRARAWTKGVEQRVQASRSTLRSVDVAFVAQVRDRTIGGNLLACAIAYRLFLWLLPVALLGAASLGFTQAGGDGQAEELGSDLGLGRSAVAVVADAAEQAERSRFLLLVLAAVGIYMAGAAGAKTIVAVHRFAWGMSPLGPRTGWRAAAAFSLVGVGAFAVSAVSQMARSASPGLGVGTAAMLAVVDGALWLGVSVLLPHAEAPWRRLVPGAVLLGLGIQAVHLFTVYYLSGKLQSSSELYGGLGVAATLLLGLYLLARLIVAAAVLNAALWERVSTESPEER